MSLPFAQGWTTGEVRELAGERPVLWMHLGNHKAASTTIQGFLTMNRTRLAELGIDTVDTGLVSDGEVEAHHRLAQSLQGASAQFDTEDLERLEAFRAELGARRPAGRDAVISSEEFESVQRADRVATIVDAIHQSGFFPVFLAYLRPQHTYINSAFSQSIYRGNLASAQQHINAARRWRRMDYAKTYVKWWRQADTYTLLRPLNSTVAEWGVARDFATVIECADRLGEEAFRIPRRNTSISAEAVLAFRLLTLQLEARHGPMAVRRAALDSLAKRLKHEGLDATKLWIVDAPTVYAIAQDFAASNARVAGRFFGAPWETVFAADYDDDFDARVSLNLGDAQYQRIDAVVRAYVDELGRAG